MFKIEPVFRGLPELPRRPLLPAKKITAERFPEAISIKARVASLARFQDAGRNGSVHRRTNGQAHIAPDRVLDEIFHDPARPGDLGPVQAGLRCRPRTYFPLWQAVGGNGFATVRIQEARPSGTCGVRERRPGGT